MAALFDGWTDHLLSEEEARPILAPYFAQFVDCWLSSWKEWEELPDHLRGRLTPTTRAGIVHNLAVARARLLFSGIKDVEVCEKLNFFKIYISDSIIVRLKRLSPFHLACNIKTKQQRRYYWHYKIAEIRESATRLSCGYVLDPTQTRIDRIVVSLQYGLEDLVWSFRVDGEAQITPIMAPKQPQPALPPISDAGPKVRPKGSKEKRKAREQ